jgi:hypothetical protein
MKLTLEILFNNADVVKAVIDRTMATQQDEIFWKRYLDFEETKSEYSKPISVQLLVLHPAQSSTEIPTNLCENVNRWVAVMERSLIWVTVTKWTKTVWI